MSLRTAKTRALRIVSLAPSATSILCSIGAHGLLVSVTKWCGNVAPVNGLPQLGDCWRLGPLDHLLRLRPTLVIGSVPFKADTIARLLEQPFQFLALNPRSLSDIENDIRVLARIVGRVQAGDRLVERMRKTFAELRKNAPPVRRRPRIYCEAWPNPRISSPPWVAELVEICGGEFVLPAGQRVEDSQVAAAKPDVIILAWTAAGAKSSPEKTYRLDAWKEIPAIRNRRVHAIRDELLNTPGPPLIEGACHLWRLIRHPVSGAA